jgi:hypothetical protein
MSETFFGIAGSASSTGTRFCFSQATTTYGFSVLKAGLAGILSFAGTPSAFPAPFL